MMDSLPDELSEGILSLLQSDPTSLYAVCRTSKTLYRIALPLLYRHFTHYLYEKPTRLHGFLRSIISKPELALAVQSVQLKDPRRSEHFWNLESWYQWAHDGYKPKLNDEDGVAFGKASRVLSESDPTYHSILLENEQAQAALLLSLTVNASCIHTDNPARITDPPRFRVNNHLFQVLVPLVKSGRIMHNLEHFTAADARLEGGQGGFRMSVISPFFRLPMLKKVELTLAHEPEDGDFVDFDCQQRASNVNHLTFTSSSLCPAALDQALGACRTLQIFECEWTGLIVGWVELNFGLLRAALLPHRTTLRRLYLDTTKRHEDWPESEDGIIPPLGRLDEFVVLEDIDVPASALIGWDGEDVEAYEGLKDVLSPVVKTLRLNAPAPRMYQQLTELAKSRKDQYPHLTRVTICDEISEDAQSSLASSFLEEQTGVTVIVETQAASSTERYSTSS